MTSKFNWLNDYYTKDPEDLAQMKIVHKYIETQYCCIHNTKFDGDFCPTCVSNIVIPTLLQEIIDVFDRNTDEESGRAECDNSEIPLEGDEILSEKVKTDSEDHPKSCDCQH